MSNTAHKLSDKEVLDAASMLVRRFGEDAGDLSNLALQYFDITGEEDLIEVLKRIHDAVRTMLDLGMSEPVSVH